MKHPIPINESEAVIQRFFDPQRCLLNEWTFHCDAGTGGRRDQNFHAVSLHWAGGNGRTVAHLERDVDMDVSEYDGVILCAVFTGTCAVTVTLTIDGRKQTPLQNVKGTFQSEEYEGPIHGRRLTRIELEVTDHGAEPSNGDLYWLGAFSGQRRAAMQARPNPFEKAWDDLLFPAGQSPKAVPQLGLLFGAEDLDALRARARREPYKTLMARMRARAEGELDKEPWRGVGPYPNMQKPRCYRLRGTEHISQQAMRFGAFVGLLEEDERLLRMAADHALALAHCDHWRPEFMATLPGSSWEQRAFYEYRYAHNVIYAWDWAGSMLTDAGKQLLAQAISTKALPWILQTLMRHPYVRGCNQGIYFAWGAILCELALSKIYPHAGEWLDGSVKAMDETVTKYFAPDGGTFEGVGYASASASHALIAYTLLSRHRNAPLEHLVPPALRKFADYVGIMLSTEPPLGATIKTADGGRAGVAIYAEFIPALYRLTQAPALLPLMRGLMESPAGLHDWGECPGPVCSVILGPDELPPAGAHPPVFATLPHTGMLCSCRPTATGPVRLQLVGGPAHAGHCHEDRGSIVIEAFGEEIAIERGQMGYDDPRCGTIGFARYHNVLIPESAEVQFPNQLNPCPAATIPLGQGDERTLRAEIDVTAAWGALTKRCVRRIESDEPAVFTVSDEVELAKPGRVSFNLHSKHPWTKTEQGWITQGKKARLCVTPEWTPESESGDEDFIDGEKKPVFHLVLTAPAATRHVLRTRLIVQATEAV